MTGLKVHITQAERTYIKLFLKNNKYSYVLTTK